MLVGAAAAAAIVAGTAAAAAAAPDPTATTSAGRRVESFKVEGVPEPGRGQTQLDARLYLPGGKDPAPAVLLAHGFGGSLAELADDATELAGQGYVVLTYTARGFGQSGGLIHLDAPDFEIADGRRMIDVLAKRPEVLKDGPDDPRVGVAGASYGGALTLMLAAADQRVDAIAPRITWNDLRQALFPQFAVTGPEISAPAAVTPIGTPGVFKKAWAGIFFGPGSDGLSSSLSGGNTPAPTPSIDPGEVEDPTSPTPTPSSLRSRPDNPHGFRPDDDSANVVTPDPPVPSPCGRFTAQLCTAYQQAATTGRPTPEILDLLADSSPFRTVGQVRAPTLLIQGENDSLFPLSEGDANAAAISRNGTPVKVVWYDGGHDGGGDVQRLRNLTSAWFGRYLLKDGTPTDVRFEVTVPDATISTQNSNPEPVIREGAGLPGVTLAGVPKTARLDLTGATQTALAPAGATPAALSSVPGLGAALGRTLSRLSSVSGGTGASLTALPGQVARFETAPLKTGLRITGAPRVDLTITSTKKNATLFAQLYDIAPGGTATLPEQLVTPIYLDDLPAAGRTVTISLPAIVHEVAKGHRLRLVLSSTDQAYAMPTDPRAYTITLAGESDLTIPQVETSQQALGGLGDVLPFALGLLAVVLLGSVGLVIASRRSRRSVPDPELEDVPLAITGLGKAYGDGYRAVTDVTFRVEPGWVLGLLGPNGAGKTTTLRMLMGLIRPSEGEIRVFGHKITAGAPVLSRVGAFVEGPGFLPHASGLDNLRLYWESTGRPVADAHLEEALEVAGLSDIDIHRKVRTYSQGMRQRLAIAQAMLGLPDLLVMDEPTNGLDPPQIREMRDVLARYAASGRTVLVSSHLLTEVEQTCSHVVVMHRGRLVAQGSVPELIGSATTLLVDVDDPARAAKIAAGVPGAQEIETTGTGMVLKLVGTPRSELVRALVDAGVGVDRITPQHGLEEAFLALVGERADADPR
jgi:ABC-2 type transport system ATP-binding protein